MLNLSNHPWMNGLFGDLEVAKLFTPDMELKRFLDVEAAWTRALGRVQEAPQAITMANVIRTADIRPIDLADGVSKDGIPVPALVKILKAQSKVEDAHLIHDGLTSQDVMDTSLVITMLDVMGIFSDRLKHLDQQIETLQAQFGDAQIMVYTRMQPAMTTRVADVLQRWRQPLPRLLSGIAKITEDCAIIQWGGPVGLRDHPQAAQLGAGFAEELGLRDPGQAWHTDRTIITDLAQVMARITIATGKIGEDIALMAAVGPQQITLGGGGSSAMPHKNNPVKAETLIALSDVAATLQSNLTRSARHEGARSGQAWVLESLCLPDLCVTTGAGLIQATHLLTSIKSIGTRL